MEIRLAQEEDLEHINVIYNQAVEEGFCTAHLEAVDMEERRRWFTAHPASRFPVLVCLCDQKVAGWLSFGPYREGRQALAHVAEVSYYIHRSYRGKGLGSALVEHALILAPDLGFSVLVAILLGENRKSIAFLEKHGFARWGAMPGIARIGRVNADHLYYGLKINR